MRTSTARRAIWTTIDDIARELTNATQAYDAALSLTRSTAMRNALGAAYDEQVHPLLEAVSTARRAGS